MFSHHAKITPYSDYLLENMLSHPKSIAVACIFIFSLFVSFIATLVAAVIFGVSRLLKIPAVWVVGVGGLLIMLVWFVDGDSVVLIHQQSMIMLRQVSIGNWYIFNQPYVWLAAAPYGVFFGGLLCAASKINIGLQNEIDRVAKGKGSIHKRKFLTPRKLAKHMQHITSSAYKDGTVLGVDRYNGKYVTLTDRDANLHTLAIGTTGSGKTTAIANVIESAIVRNHPLFYIDGKGDLDLAKRIERYANQVGRRFYLFSIVGESVKYNPIACGGYTSKKDRIVELREWSEDHYRKIAEGYLQTVFQILEQANISIDLHTVSQYLEPNSLYQLARQLKDESMLGKIAKLEGQRKDISSLVAEIENMANSEIGQLFDCKDGEVLTLDKALSENAIVYFCLQPLAFPAYAETLGKLIINDIKALAATLLQTEKRIKLFTIFDEFSVFAGDQVINLINQGRGAGIHALLATQSLSDIVRRGDEALLGQVLNNCNNYIIQRQNNPDDAEVLANIIGTNSGFQVTSQVSDNGGTGTGSVRETREFIVHPDEIKRLGLGQAFVVNKQNFNVNSVELRRGKI